MDLRSIQSGVAGVDLAMAAVAWLILLCTYPDFACWRPEGFAVHHEAYTRRVGWVVGPLLLAQLAGHAWLAVVAGHGPELGLVVVCWVLTGAWSVPCHRRLQQEGPASPALADLIRSHRWRTVLWTLVAVLAGWRWAAG
jgi:mRNA-degrading endonuclease toxin of MazEF toxin-antitoxin module